MSGHQAPQHGKRHADDDDAGAPRDPVPEARVFVFAHEVGAIDEHQHEDDDHREKDAIEHLGEDGDVDQLRIWEQ